MWRRTAEDAVSGGGVQPRNRAAVPRADGLAELGLGPRWAITATSCRVPALQLREAAAAHGIDLRTPFGDLPKRAQTLLLYGSESNGERRGRRFAGLIPLLQQNYEEALSESACS